MVGSDKWPASQKTTLLQLSMETDDRIFNTYNETFPLILDIAEFHCKATGAFNLQPRCVHEAKTLKVAKLKRKVSYT